jgi:hypothetical protein
MSDRHLTNTNDAASACETCGAGGEVFGYHADGAWRWFCEEHRKLKHDAEDTATWHGMLLLIQRDRSYDPYFVQAKFKEKFGCRPPKGTIPKPIPPSPEVSAWVRPRLIAFAKSKRRAA